MKKKTSATEKKSHAAQQLGYRPHASASTLRAGRTRTVGLLVPDITNPFLGHVLRGAQRAGRADGITVALIEPGPERNWQLTAVEALNAAAIDAMMLFGIEPPLSEAPGPTVLIEAVADGFTSVLLDVRQGTTAAVAAMQRSQAQAEGSVDNALQAAEALSGINLQVEAISGMSLQIATAVEEQSAVGEDIQRNLDGIREAGQSTVAASGRSRHSAEHVASLVERLQLLAEQFRGNAQRG